MRWRRVFPGRDDHVSQVRRFVAELLAGYPERDDVALCATELATNAIRHTASGRDGFFAIELSWAGMTIRLAVADGGAPTRPVLRQRDPDMLEEAGRGLDVVASLCDRYGFEGDHRGRVVWAQFSSASAAASHAARVPLVPHRPPRRMPPCWPGSTRDGIPGSAPGPASGGRFPDATRRPRC